MFIKKYNTKFVYIILWHSYVHLIDYEKLFLHRFQTNN